MQALKYCRWGPTGGNRIQATHFYRMEFIMSRPVHFEIAADDIARATKFFSNVFGWQFQGHGDGNYQMAETGSDPMGINGGIFKRTSPQQPQVMNSIGVASIEAACAKIIANGGTITSQKSAVPGMGWYATFNDTEGNPHGLWTPDPAAK